MMSVLDFDFMDKAGIEGVDVESEINEDDLQEELKAILNK